MAVASTRKAVGSNNAFLEMNITPAFIRRRIAHRPNLLRIVDNMSWLTVDKILRMGVGLVIGIWVARHLGPEMFGALSFALAILGILAGVGTLGLQNIVVRDIVCRRKRAPRIIGTSLALQAAAGLVIYVGVLAALAKLGPQDELLRLLVAIVSARMLVQCSSVFEYWFEAQVQSRFTVVAQVTAFGITSISKIILILIEAPVFWFAAAVFFEAVLAAVLLAIIFLKFGLTSPRPSIDFRMARYLLRQSWPLIISAVAVGLAMRVDQVMIGLFLETRDVGYYSVAVRIAEILALPGMILASSIFPRLLSLGAQRFHFEYVRILRYPFYSLFAAAAMLAIAAEPLINFIFGRDFAAAAPALSVVVFSIPLTYISVMTSKYLLMLKDPSEILRRQLAGLFINIGLNLLLIPWIGIVGAAFATVLTDFLISIAMDFGRSRYKPLLALKIEALTGLRISTT